MDPDVSKAFKGLAGRNATSNLAEEGRDDPSQKAFEATGEPFTQRLFSVGGVGGQADDCGGMLQGEVGFGSEGQEALGKFEHGDFTWAALQKA